MGYPVYKGIFWLARYSTKIAFKVTIPNCCPSVCPFVHHSLSIHLSVCHLSNKNGTNKVAVTTIWLIPILPRKLYIPLFPRFSCVDVESIFVELRVVTVTLQQSFLLSLSCSYRNTNTIGLDQNLTPEPLCDVIFDAKLFIGVEKKSCAPHMRVKWAH